MMLFVCRSLCVNENICWYAMSDMMTWSKAAVHSASVSSFLLHIRLSSVLSHFSIRMACTGKLKICALYTSSSSS